MKNMRTVLGIIFYILIFHSCKENPVKPENNNPEILSLMIFPEVVGPNDSVLVVCDAVDPDGDTLVYDWITTGVVRIRGAFDDDHWLYHTLENSRVFYAPENKFITAPLDTFRIQCFVRDVKGGADAQIIRFIVKKDIGGG